LVAATGASAAIICGATIDGATDGAGIATAGAGAIV
jgi:hypothetical protein